MGQTPISKSKEEVMIETSRLILRPWQESETTTLYKYASYPEIDPIAGWPSHTSVENSLEIIRTVFAVPETYAVVFKETGEPIGCCGIMFSNSLHTAAMPDGQGEIGYCIGKPYWGQGLMPDLTLGDIRIEHFNKMTADDYRQLMK